VVRVTAIFQGEPRRTSARPTEPTSEVSRPAQTFFANPRRCLPPRERIPRW